MHRNSFLFQISGGTFHVVLNFPCALFIAKHCYCPKSEWINPKVRSEKILLFFRKETSSNLVFTFITEKKIATKIYNFFSVHQNCKTKKFAISKISNKKFREIHYFANTKYKRNSRKYCEKTSSQKYLCEKKKFRQKKFDKQNLHQKKFFEKKIRKKFLK